MESSSSPPPPPSPPLADLTNEQMVDLGHLWALYERDLFVLRPLHGIPDETAEGEFDVLDPTCLDNTVMCHISRLFSFLSSCVESATNVADSTAPVPPDQVGAKTFESLRWMFHVSRDGDSCAFWPRDAGEVVSVFRSDSEADDGESFDAQMVRTVRFDSESFETEMVRFEHPRMSSQQYRDYVAQHSFGSYLHSFPGRALAAIGCAIGLLLANLHRQRYTRGDNVLRHRHLRPEQLVDRLHRILKHTRYCVRFTNFRSPVPMADIKTELAHRFIVIRGHVVRARPKHLRAVEIGCLCNKCGVAFDHQILDGVYQRPSRCPAEACRSRSFTPSVANAQYIDAQFIRLQELQDDVSAAGRPPRTMEVCLLEELVDICGTGDIVVVCGIVRYSQTTAGRKGKGGGSAVANFYFQANSVLNETAECDQLATGGDAGGREGGGCWAMFSESQRERIVHLVRKLEHIRQWSNIISLH